MTRLEVSRATLGYPGKTVSQGLSVEIPDDAFTVIIGPNACGKSTLLKSLVRVLHPLAGSVLLDGHSISTLPTREVAKQLGLLPQDPTTPEGVRVVDLVARGRYPHQKMFQAWSPADEHAVKEAMAATRVTDLSGRLVDELSGGQRQRVWMAVALAQQTPILLLDEPTTFLDMTHQIELLELCRTLNRDKGHTIIAVLHDLNQACRYAEHLIVMRGGQIVTTGRPDDVMTVDLLQDVFGLAADVMADPQSGTPLIVPVWQHR